MEQLKYYKRGKGELDTSNFPAILKQGQLTVDVLDEKTFFSLLCFNEYLVRGCGWCGLFPVMVKGYVHHMRADKDLFDPADLYGMLSSIELHCEKIQHESNGLVQSAQITCADVLKDLDICPWFTRVIGADASVPKFMPDVQQCAQKVREGGKVVSVDISPTPTPFIKRIVIVDDILGGGTTVKMLVEKLREQGFKGDIFLWVQYNEGIHPEGFTGMFSGVYLGESI